MELLLLVIFATVGISFLCSLTEALVLSTTVGEIESLKRRQPKRGERLQLLKTNLEETTSTILTLNTVANTLGSIMIGGIATRLYGDAFLGVVSTFMTFTILIFAEVIPKNLGVIYRRQLQPHVVTPLWTARRLLYPINYVCNRLVRAIVRVRPDETDSDEEILLLARRGAADGSLSSSESSIIANALSLDEIRVSEIMTPRTVVTALRKHATIAEVFREYPNIPFARIPVYHKGIDDIVGLVRRRDLLKAKANDLDFDLVEKHMQEIHFIPETVTAANALQVFLKTHQQLLVVVDEFGSTAGVITMEDVMEHILGREIFEKDDVAVDMRELARAKLLKQQRTRRTPDGGNIAPFPQTTTPPPPASAAPAPPSAASPAPIKPAETPPPASPPTPGV